PFHPGQSRPSVFVEACGTDDMGGISLGYVNQYPEDDGDSFRSIDAQESFDDALPQALRAYPNGFGAAHFVAPQTEIEYHFRFQHLGGDTLSEVVIEDRLPKELNVRTVRPGASSHPYDFEILGEGILRFSFKDIQLPGNLINEAASHGFVKFKVQQNTNLLNGTVIGNQMSVRLGDTLLQSNVVEQTILQPSAYGAALIELCANEPFNGQFFTADTTVLDTFLLIDYDSIAITNIEVLPNAMTLIDTVLMDDRIFQGIRYDKDTTLLEVWPGLNGCDSLVTINIMVDISEVENPIAHLLQVQVYPNPARDYWLLSYTLPQASSVRLSLYDLDGQKIRDLDYQAQQTAGLQHYVLSADSLSPGTYGLRLDTQWGSTLYKLVKL
ncbi:MAG: T9SS type A sorting domain-containing protein, partial [Bacteroidota bacterium]